MYQISCFYHKVHDSVLYPLDYCDSVRFHLRAAAVHYPLLRKFICHLYRARKLHRNVLSIDDHALYCTDFKRLLSLCGLYSCKEIFYSERGNCSDSVSSGGNTVLGLPGLEPQLKVRHAEFITRFEKEVDDDPEFACCSCERLFQRKNRTSMKSCDTKFTTDVWNMLKCYILSRIDDEKVLLEEIELESLFICQYCRPSLTGVFSMAWRQRPFLWNCLNSISLANS